jgi:mono/diheme cytochrome c family protein
MRMKALGVMLMVSFAAFTTFYWITDAPRREGLEATRDEQLLEFGRIVFLPDDTFSVDVDLRAEGFTREVGEEVEALDALELFVNTSISFKNETGGTVTVTGTGTTPFELDIEDSKTAPVKFDEEGETTVRMTGTDGELAVSAIPPDLQPYGANCARCHGVNGEGGVAAGAPSLRSLSLANKWAQTGGAQGFNNYVSWVITLGGVVVRGDISSLMPAWGQDYGGSLTRQQIEALTAMIGGWAQETLDNPPTPPPDVPDTVEEGEKVYAANCSSCHGADLEGVVGPNLQTIGTSLITTVPPLITETLDIDQMQADYDADKRTFLENWIRNSADYNGGTPTAMPVFGEDMLTDSQLRALITFLLDQTE